MKLSSILIIFLVFGLFLVMFISGSDYLALNNEPSQSFSSNYDSLNSLNDNTTDELYTAYDNTADAELSLNQSGIETSGEGITINAYGSMWRILKASPTVVFNLFATFLQQQGILSSIVLTTLGTILTIIVLMAIWRMVRQGDG